MNSHKNQGNFLTTRGGINRAAHLIVLCNGIDCIMKLICRRNNKSISQQQYTGAAIIIDSYCHNR